MYDKRDISKRKIEEQGGCRRKAFLKKKKALANVELEEAVNSLKALLLPIVDSIASGTEYSSKWDYTSRSWK